MRNVDAVDVNLIKVIRLIRKREYKKKINRRRNAF